MKQGRFFFLIVFLIILSVSFLSCSDSERRLGFTKGTTTVVLNLGLQQEHAMAPKSFIDTIFSFFVPEAVAQTAPAAFSSISVLVTGPDISPIESNFTSGNSISLTVPSGNLRQFLVTAHVDPADPSAALSFRGTSVANLPEGVTVSVPVVMVLNETKIVVPDFRNQRIVIIDNFTTPNWTARTTINWTTMTGTLWPHDVDFDARGRLYIANNVNPGGVIRMDDINGTGLIQTGNLLFGNINNVVTLAVDRINNYVYFATNFALYRSSLDGTSTSSALTLPSIFSGMYIRGIDVDTSGMLYIVVAPLSAGLSYIVKYNPNSESQIGTEYSTNLSNPWDVQVRGSDIYVANYGQYTAGYQIMQFTFSNNTFTLATHNGNRSTSTTGTGYFYGASRFLAIRNDVLIVADSNQGSTPTDFDQLVSFSDMSFANWASFGSFGSLNDQFKLYSFC
jgi:hypothetical protein